VIEIERVEAVVAGGPVIRRVDGARAIGLCVAVVAEPARHVLVRVEIPRRLAREQPLDVFGRERAVEPWKEAAGVDRLERVGFRALGGDEEVRFVLRQRTAERSAELVPPVVLLADRLAPRVDSRPFGMRFGVERSIAQELEGAAGPDVGAALGDHVHHAADASSVLGLVVRRLEIELLDGLQREQLQQATDRIVVVVAAVDQVVDVATVAAVDLRRELSALGGVGVETESHTGNRRGQVRELPAVQWKALDTYRVDDAADRRRSRHDQRRRAGDVDRLGQRDHFECEVDRLDQCHGDFDVLLRDRAEPRKRGLDLVDTDRQRCEPVDALGVGRLRPREARRLVPGGDRHPGDRIALLVEHPAADRARGLLRQCRHAGEQQKQRCPRQTPSHSDASTM
jgi:hypothetical protein